MGLSKSVIYKYKKELKRLGIGEVYEGEVVEIPALSIDLDDNSSASIPSMEKVGSNTCNDEVLVTANSPVEEEISFKKQWTCLDPAACFRCELPCTWKYAFTNTTRPMFVALDSLSVGSEGHLTQFAGGCPSIPETDKTLALFCYTLDGDLFLYNGKAEASDEMYWEDQAYADQSALDW